MTDENNYRPFDPESHLAGCACGCRNGATAWNPKRGSDAEDLSRDFMEMAAVRALIPDDRARRRFLKAVGTSTAMAAIHSLLPLQSLQAMATESKGALEKKELKIGFIPICCATPLIMADPLGFYRNEGLDVSLRKTAGWALVRDQMLNAELDASHFLSPMPLSISLGLASEAQPMRVATIQNVNGQAITLALKHKNNRDPRNWKGFRFAIPFDYSMHNFLLRYYLAEHGIDPDKDVQLRITSPADMVANLRAGNIDGFLGPEPFNQRAVYDEIGFIHLLTKEIWDGHPCCAFGVSQRFIDQAPNSFAALYRAMLKAAAAANDHANRAAIAKAISPSQYLNQPEAVVRQALTGHFADGLGNVRDVPDRIGFSPVPWYSMATWMLTQMRRWGYIKQDVDYAAIARQVFELTDATRLMTELGMPVPATANTSGLEKITVMGRTYDPTQPAAYAASFAIKRT